ncbi:MAG: hypothetical protein KDK78_10855, partial [Chlamydiia bacterium]|nr:hypothetical protein [Chlamydiia bacterium]
FMNPKDLEGDTKTSFGAEYHLGAIFNSQIHSFKNSSRVAEELILDIGVDDKNGWDLTLHQPLSP